MREPKRIAPWRLQIALAVTMTLAALACGDTKSGSTKSSALTPARAAPGPTVPTMGMESASGGDSTVLQLAAATDTALAGTPVRLSVAHAQSVMSDRGFWIGIWGQQVYVFQTASAPAPVHGGEAYAVVGTVRVAPHSTQGAPHGMAPIDVEALHAQHIYIAADSVAPSAR